MFWPVLTSHTLALNGNAPRFTNFVHALVFSRLFLPRGIGNSRNPCSERFLQLGTQQPVILLLLLKTSAHYLTLHKSTHQKIQKLSSNTIVIIDN